MTFTAVALLQATGPAVAHRCISCESWVQYPLLTLPLIFTPAARASAQVHGCCSMTAPERDAARTTATTTQLSVDRDFMSDASVSLARRLVQPRQAVAFPAFRISPQTLLRPEGRHELGVGSSVPAWS